MMYMAFVMNILHLENFGRDLPGEWIQADLCLPTSEDDIMALKDEYKRKQMEDTNRTRTERNKKGRNSKSVSDTPVFDYGQIIVNDKIKVAVCISLPYDPNH
jgi:hypothetical protein